MKFKPNFYQEVYKIVSQIPKGKVTTYGNIALLLGIPRGARAVGFALNALKKTETKIPWQRVINSQGKISFKGDVFRATLQRELLEKEGIQFDKEDKIDLLKYGWLLK
ncbi:MAG: MGMT family protein [Leptospiraceae bacterium]|nr:MGMT family protein [Leptospiraceae bacterium]